MTGQPVTRICAKPECTNTFTTTNPRKLYCGELCRNAAKQARHRKGLKRGTPTVPGCTLRRIGRDVSYLKAKAAQLRELEVFSAFVRIQRELDNIRRVGFK